MPKTLIRPSRDLRNNYRNMVKSLEEHDHIIITNNGAGESVLISIKDYEEYEKFLHHRFIYNELQKTKASAANPSVNLHEAADVFAGIEKRLGEHGL